MNTGTKIRTALRIAVSLNTAIYAVSAAVGALGFGWLTMAWAIFTIISDFAVSALTTYFNQDYTQEACIGTGQRICLMQMCHICASTLLSGI